MSNKTYTVRVPSGTQDISSEQAATSLERQLTSNAPLATDPGAGEKTLRLSLDADKVKAGAQVAGEAEAVFLRRLIASNVRVPEQVGKPEPEAKPKAPVLKGALRLQPEQMRPVVDLADVAQAAGLRWIFHLPANLDPSYLRYTAEERDSLAALSAEVVNRRAPAAVVENADLLGLALKFAAIEARKIEMARAVAEQLRRQQQPAGAPEAGPPRYEVQQ